VRASIILLAISLLSHVSAEESQVPASERFESEGMHLYLEQLIQTDDVIWAMDFIDTSSLIFTERKGRIKLLDLDTSAVSSISGGPAVYTESSGGLFDILVDPDFETNGFIYLTYIKAIGEGSATAVAKGRLEDNELVDLEDLFVANNASSDPAHWGSRVIMDRDRHLYISVGDRHVPDNAQDLESHGGKILRLNDDGSIPPDNPFTGRTDAAPEIWSYGHRNPQGLAIHPDSGILFEQEHGPTGGDEINLVERGKNYGWPVITYGENIFGGQARSGTAKPGMEQPLKFYNPGIAPSGMTFYLGDRYPAWNGNLFSSTLRGHLNRLVLDGTTVVAEERLLNDWRQRMRDVVQGPDGLLYLSTESGTIARIVPLQ
jgi:glucose/arabinose dehydrogenase